MENKNKSKYFEKPWLKFYPEGIPAEVEIPVRSIPQAFDEATEKWKNKTALIFYGAEISYSQLRDEVYRFATALHNLGVKKGDRVALLLLNSPQFIIAYYGALKLGAIVTSVSPVYVSSEVKHQLENSGTETMVCQDILYDIVERTGVELHNVILTSINEYLPRFKKVMGKSILRGVYKKMEMPTTEILRKEGLYQFQELIKKYPPNPPEVEINAEDIAVLPYTTGTTGLSKGVILSHYNMLAGEYISNTFWPLEEGKEVQLAYLPFYHIFALALIVLGAILRGYTTIIFTTPDPDDILSAALKYRASVFMGAPAMYEILRDYEKTDRIGWKRYKYVVSGADALLEDTAAGWKERTGVELYNAWGMTEISGPGICNPVGRIKRGTFGIPLPNTSAAVIDPDTNEFLPVGEIGELIYNGPQVTKGYWKNPEESKKDLIEIDGDIWLKTGDLVTMDAEGYFTFYDRGRDRIKYKGYRISAREIEDVIALHPKVKEVGVIGIPDAKVGEQIKAVVVPHIEARGKLSEEDIINWCEKNLAHIKVPKIVEFRGEIPKTDVGKVSRRELREE